MTDYTAVAEAVSIADKELRLLHKAAKPSAKTGTISVRSSKMKGLRRVNKSSYITISAKKKKR